MSLHKTGNIAIGFTIISVGISTLVRISSIGDFTDILRICVFICNLFMGILLIFRREAEFELHPFIRPYWLGMMISNIIVFKYSDDSSLISFPSLVLLIGACWTIFSICSLGRQFSLFPASSRIVTRGAYQIVRHPIYLGESLMLVSCLLSNLKWVNFIALIAFMIFLCMRINLEEQVMAKGNEYSNYQKIIKWKLLPYVW